MSAGGDASITSNNDGVLFGLSVYFQGMVPGLFS